jgi:succinate dehydrogenase / fumarate reductase flavoprotein subunit
VVLATGGYGRAISRRPRRHTCTGDGNAMVLRAGLPLQDMEFVQFHPTGIYGAGRADHRGRARRGRLPHQFGRASASWSATRRRPRTWPAATSSPARWRWRSAKGRGVGKDKDHIYLHLDHLEPKVLAERLPGITETGKVFAGVDLHPAAAAGGADRSLQYGRHPDQLLGRGRHAQDGNPDSIVPGLFAGRRGGLRVRARRQPASAPTA